MDQRERGYAPSGGRLSQGAEGGGPDGEAAGRGHGAEQPLSSGPDVEALALRAQGGEAGALEEVSRQFLPLLRALCHQTAARAPLPCTVEEADLFQEAFLCFLQVLQRWDPSRGVPLPAYVWRMAAWHLSHHLARQWRRARGNILDEEELLRTLDAQRLVEAPTADGVDMERALATLPDFERRLLHLLYTDDLTRESAARALGVSLSTVDRGKRAALARLRALLRRDHSA